MPAAVATARKTTRYRDAREECRSGDLMVLNVPGSVPWIGRGGASHVGMIVWRHADQNSLRVAESRYWTGGRDVSLSSQVRRFPGLISIYTPKDDCPHELRERAATIAFNWAGHEYDSEGIVQLCLLHAPIARLVAEQFGVKLDPTDMRLLPWAAPKFCSTLYAWSYRWAPCPGLGDRFVEPADLVRSGAVRLVAKGLVID
jgi:hypothetical protein